jgi:hydroxybutyrate-dimer hydrolase
MKRHSLALAAAFAASCVFAAEAPPVVPGSVKVTSYDGITDDLLSAGLNLAGLVNPVAPGFADPENPTPAELRKRAIHSNYRGIVDTCVAGVPFCVPGSGIGLLWGPGSAGAPTFPAPVVPGLIPGVEYKAYLRVSDRQGHVNNVPAAVQIPRHFDPANPCIVAAMPSGSRSLYGGIAVAEWALFKGCAVALPGKGTDTGFHLLTPNLADDIDGVYQSADALGEGAQFALKPSRRLDDYIAANPHRVATKHAHSELNPERLWGDFALQGIRFAFWALNDHLGAQGSERFHRKNTVVIAAAASNGGGMALRALEQDAEGLVDGLVVTEPNIAPQDGGVTIQFGGDAPFKPAGRSIYDSMTLMSVYAACAAHAPGAAGTLLFGPQTPLGVNRCTSLREKGLITGETLAAQAESARAKIREHGYAAAQDWGIASHDTLALWRSLQPTYAGAYGRFAVEDNICGVSFAATDPITFRPVPLATAVAKRLFADSSGIPATGGVNLIADRAANGPILEAAAISRSTNRADLNLDSALCFRFLETGDATLLAGTGATESWAEHAKVDAGTRAVETTGRLHGRPAIIIHGRQDALVFPNLHSRAYYALNQQNDVNSRLSYIEVTPGQHFDAFMSSFFRAPTTGVQFAPLHYYYVKAMDSMYAHLTIGAPLPPSQVVRPTPRGFVEYTPANVPALLPLPSLTPAAGDRITFSGGVLTIPE